MHAIQEIFEMEGFKTRSYSGRGMYGESCLGVEIGGDKELGRIISALILGVEDCSRDAVAAAVKNLRTDSMGPGTVVYFPGVKYYELG